MTQPTVHEHNEKKGCQFIFSSFPRPSLLIGSTARPSQLFGTVTPSLCLYLAPLPVSGCVGPLYGILNVDDGPDLVRLGLEDVAELGQQFV